MNQIGCLFVAGITRDGLAFRFPRITLGARLLEIDGHCLLSSTRDFVSACIADCHERNAPIKMILQILDRQQWERLSRAMNKGNAALNADKSVITPLPLVNRASARIAIITWWWCVLH